MSLSDCYTSYNDAAGGRDHGFVVVSGWVSNLMRWASFVGAWRTVLADFEVPYFHMKEFSQSKGPFVDWKEDEPKRAQFLAALVSVIKENVDYGVACFVNFETFERIDRKYRFREAVGVPYSLAGRDCIAHVHNFLRRKEGGLPHDVKHIFDDGDDGKGELIRVVRKDGYPPPKFEPSRDRRAKDGTSVHGLVQLQAADFAAYELRKAMKDDPYEEWMPWEHRKSFQALATIDSEWALYTYKDLLRICRAVPIQPRKRKVR